MTKPFRKYFCSEHYKIRQLIPATGWRMLLASVTTGADETETVETSITHLVGWALLENKNEEPGEDRDVVPVIPDPYNRTFIFDFSAFGIASVLIQPGADPTPEQESFVKAYAREIRDEETAYYDACEKAREMRRANSSYEHIAKITGLSNEDARRVALCVDREMVRERARETKDRAA